MRILVLVASILVTSSNFVEARGTVVASCYRGPLKQVIWDRPNAIFVESLTSVGYRHAEAYAIAEQVCRNQDLVDRPEAMSKEVRRILRTSPPDGRQQYRY